MPIKLTVSQPAPVRLSYVEAAIKPEVTGHVTPTYEEQTVYPAAGTVFGSVEVDAIPDPTAIKEIDSNGDHDVRRYGTARVSVTPTLQTKEVTPTKQTQTVVPDTDKDGLSAVEVKPIPSQYIIPEGCLDITQNANGIDVTDKASVNVNVPIPTMPDEYPIGGSMVAKTMTGYHFADGLTAIPNEAFRGSSNLVSIDIPTTVTSIGNGAFRQCPALLSFTFPSGITSLSQSVLYLCTNLQQVICLGDISNIAMYAFEDCPKCGLFYFPNNTKVPTLASTNAFSRHKSGAVIRVPAALLSEWQAATNWNALTGVVWEGV